MQAHEYLSHYAQTFRTVELRGNTDLSPSFDIPGIRLDQSVLRTRIFLRTLVQIHRIACQPSQPEAQVPIF
jgi:hypothetical protein